MDLKQKNKNLNRVIIEVGAFDGADGIALAYKNPNIKVHSFEANPQQIKTIKKNKKLLEKRKGITLNNFKIYNYAISSKNKYLNFYISKNPKASSLNILKKDLEKYWPGWREVHFRQNKKIKIKSLTLKKFLDNMRIDTIEYIHVDAQGSDLDVLKSLNKYIGILNAGVVEVAKNKFTSLYKKNSTFNDIKKFLKRDFEIYNVQTNTLLKNEFNVFFKRKFHAKSDINLKYNIRYFNRIFYKKNNFKDDIFDFTERLINMIKKIY